MKFLNEQIELLHNKYVEAIFQVAHIEDRGITFQKTYEIINNLDKAEQELPKRQIDIVLGIKKAYQYVIEIANSIEPITTRDLQNINRLINEYESDTKAGEWRKWPVGISATKYVPPIKSVDEYQKMFSSYIQKDYSFIDICKLCALITKLQPFNNGNKRTAICFCNALLVKKNIIPIQVTDCGMYIEKLINYYEDDKKIDDYVRFVCEQSHYFDINNKELSGNDNAIFNIISSNPSITKKEIAQLLNVSIPTISRSIIYLTKNKYINGKTSNKGGKWIINK